MDHYADSQPFDELHGFGPGDPDYNTPPWEKPVELPKPNVYKIQPPKPEYAEQDNWSGSPDQAWA